MKKMTLDEVIYKIFHHPDVIKTGVIILVLYVINWAIEDEKKNNRRNRK